MEKTIKEWFESIGNETIRQQALENMDEHFIDYKRRNGISDSIKDAIMGGFDWEETEQGHGYWSNIWNYFYDYPQSDLSEYDATINI